MEWEFESSDVFIKTSALRWQQHILGKSPVLILRPIAHNLKNGSAKNVSHVRRDAVHVAQVGVIAAAAAAAVVAAPSTIVSLRTFCARTLFTYDTLPLFFRRGTVQK